MSEIKVNETRPATTSAPQSPAFASFHRPGFPFPFARDFFGEMDRTMRTQFGEAFWAPAIDVKRTNGTMIVKAELPGLKKDEIHVESSNEMLTISGERKFEEKEETEESYRLERSYGQFMRSIPLPEGAKIDEIKAELNEGVLTLSVPVPELKAKTRQIPIEPPKAEKASAGS